MSDLRTELENFRTELKHHLFSTRTGWLEFLQWWDGGVEPQLVAVKEKIPKAERDEYHRLESIARQDPGLRNPSVVNTKRGTMQLGQQDHGGRIGSTKVDAFDALLKYLLKYV